jgi:hypothetical protein
MYQRRADGGIEGEDSMGEGVEMLIGRMPIFLGAKDFR